MPTDYQRDLNLAVHAVREAARLCRSVQRTLGAGVMHKGDRSPVTIADFGSQALVCSRIRAEAGNEVIIAEESAAALAEAANSGLLGRVVEHVRDIEPAADAASVRDWIDQGTSADYTPRFWTLDPIDGTKGFLRGDQYVVALALIVEGELTVAAVAAPNLKWSADPSAPVGTLFTAVAGRGAFMRSLDGADAPTPIHVSRAADPAQARFAESLESGHTSHGASAAIAAALGIAAAPVRMDSQAKYGVVARGDAEMYLRLPSGDYIENIWDHAAGALLVTEAGGRVTDTAGEPLDFTHGRRLEANRGVVATNGLLHDRVLAAIKSLQP